MAATPGDDVLRGDGTANSIAGGAGNDQIHGFGGADRLFGGAGRDSLFGGTGHDLLNGGLGLDRLAGGSGNDIYVVNAPGDVVVEAGKAGLDRVNAGVSWTLGANVENLTLIGTAAINGSGNALRNVITGNGAGNSLLGQRGLDTLFGGAGNDWLDGGAGDDRLEGGTGGDRYLVDSSGDTVIEAKAGGTDLVTASVSFVLGSDVENLTLTGTSGLAGTGNALSNQITGNSASNNLRGREGDDVLVGGEGNDRMDGGVGNDQLSGGRGNDLYLVDATGDIVTEAANAGLDQVRADTSHVLGVNVENLTLVGSAALNGTGNGLENLIYGNDAANTLAGLQGNDTLYGQGGNDLIEGGAGSDRLYGRTGNDTLLGGDGVDRLQGDSGSDRLVGGNGDDGIAGGADRDILTGSLGSDVFTFYEPKQGGDIITDFHNVLGDDDSFSISVSQFQAGLKSGVLSDDQFVRGEDNLARDANDRFIFRVTDETLWFDRNGSAEGGLTLIADLQDGANVTSADILLRDDILV